MSKDIQQKHSTKEFEKFDALLRQVIQIPKDEINKREKEAKLKKKVKKG